MEQMSDLKTMLLDMMAWFHEFCQKNSLRYYAIGGTMLGAARHEGFIPWDDDIDVGMPRADYLKLEALIGNKIVDNYYFETTKSLASDYSFTYGKIFNTGTTLVENRKKTVKRGIYIDVFPLDGATDEANTVAEYYSPIAKLQNILLVKVVGVRKGRSFIKNIAAAAGYLIPDFILSEKKVIQRIDEECSKHDFDSYRYGGNFNGNWGIKEIMPTEYYGNPTLYNFEGIKIYGVEKYDQYLTHIYGDWRQLPPVEKRVTHHDNIEMDLNKPYM